MVSADIIISNKVDDYETGLCLLDPVCWTDPTVSICLSIWEGFLSFYCFNILLLH